MNIAEPLPTPTLMETPEIKSQLTTEVKKYLSKIFEQSLRISSPLYQLEMIRQKLEARSLQSFDKKDILEELGSIQHTMHKLDSEMLRIHDLLKKQS